MNSAASAADADNPLNAPFTAPFGAPPFDAVTAAHVEPAIRAGMAAERAEIAAITANPAPPDFANTIAALERAGRGLDRARRVFGALASTMGSEEIRAVERALAPVLAAHEAAIALDGDLFARIDAVHAGRERADLTPEQIRLVERIHLRFVRAGARLDAAGKARFAEIQTRLAELYAAFRQNVTRDEADWTLALSGEADLAGLSASARAQFLQAGADRGRPGTHLVTLSRSSVETFLRVSARRDLREAVFTAWRLRGDNEDAEDNRATIAEIVALRHERAVLLGYAHHAAFRLADRMAETPEAALGLMDQVWAPARARAEADREALTALLRADGINGPLEPWDWRYYAEKLRKARFDYDEAELKPYLQVDRMVAAMFAVSTRLFGLDFAERSDIPVYHPDVRVFEVTRNGAHVGLFYADLFAREGKRSGAWATAYRTQSHFDGTVTPLIGNVLNVAKSTPGTPQLMTWWDAETLFHEFGHALHGLLSNVTYPTLAGTAVPTDFVEFPAQIYEHWLAVPEVLAEFARHAETGEAMPPALIEKVRAARSFDQGFATVEFLASAYVDMDLHMSDGSALSRIGIREFEAATSERIGQPREIDYRHRPVQFLHLFSGEGYSAGYYAYLWSEMLDTDGFAAFREAGDPFDPELARRLHDHVYSAGNLRDPKEAYRLFRGRDPQVRPLLEHRGLIDPES